MSVIQTSAAMPWTFLGQGLISGSAAVRTPLVSWVGAYQQLMIEHFVAGYNGSAIARLVVGPAAGLSETGTTFCTTLSDTVTTTTTNTNVVSKPGWPLAGGTAAAVRREGWHWIKNLATDVKSMTGLGNYAGTAPTTSPSHVLYSGLFNDTTNLIQQAELAVYSDNTTTSVSGTTMNVGSYLVVWGRNNN
jgi:hypothetical protein